MMQTIKQLLYDCFNREALPTFQDIGQRVPQLTLTSNVSAPLLQSIQQAKFLTYCNMSATMQNDIISFLDVLTDTSPQTFEDAVAVFETLTQYGLSADQSNPGEYTISNYNGAMINLVGYYVPETKLGFLELRNASIDKTLAHISTDPATEEFTFFLPTEVDVSTPTSGNTTVELSAIADQASDSQVSTEALLTILGSASQTGSITVQKIQNIIAGFGNTDTLLRLRDIVSTMDELSYQNVTMIIGQVMAQTNGQYKDGDSYYNVFSTPTFLNDILSVIVSIAITVIVTALTAIFHSLAAIISVIASVLSTIISAVKQTLPQTEATVFNTDEVAAVNVPISQGVEGDFNALTYRYIEDQLPYFNTLCTVGSEHEMPFVTWIFPSGEQKFTAQALPRCVSCDVRWMQRPENHPSYEMTYTTDALTLNGWNILNKDLNFRADPAASRIMSVYSDQQLRQMILLNMMYSFISLNLTPTRTRMTVSTLTVSPEYPLQMIEAISNTPYGLSDQRKFVAAYFLWMINDDEKRPRFDEWATWDHIIELSSNSFFNSAITDSLLKYTKDQYSLLPGSSVLNYTVECPKLSKSAIWRALLVGGLAVATVAFTGLIVKKQLKSRAVKKLALREAQFKDAQNALLENPNDKQAIKAYYKANKKLSRAWNSAGKAGVDMYNGFSTGSSDVSTTTPSETSLESLSKLIVGK